MDHFDSYMSAQDRTRLARAKYSAAALEIRARELEERCFEIMSQHEPIATLGLDRDVAIKLVRFILSGDRVKA